MKAAVINQYGSSEVFEYREDIAQPQIQPDQLLVKAYAASVNPVDWKIRHGMVRLLTGNQFPMVLGFDVSGEVVAVGSQVSRFQPGDLVYAFRGSLPGGTYAEYVAVSEREAAPKPRNLTHEQAAAVPLAALTALQALRDQGKLQPGQKVLINGASGGVGIFAVQLAKILGADVTGVCSPKNRDLVQKLGCDRVIDYTQQDFTQTTAEYDLIFDVVGNRSFSQCCQVLKPQGIYITTQPLPGKFLESFLRRLLPGQQMKVIVLQASSQDLADLTSWIEAGKIQVLVDRTYPLQELAAAHDYGEAGHTVGKIVITIDPDSASGEFR